MKIISKKGFLLRDISIAAIFGVAIIAFYVMFISGMAVNYERPDLVNKQFTDNYNKIDRLTSGIELSRNTLTNSSSGISLIGSLSIGFNGFFTIVTMAWDTLDIFSNALANIGGDYPFISPLVIKILALTLLSALTVYIIYVIISSVMRGRV